jgi:diguanylate cyclase (GGDEF)-like protein
MDSAEARNSRPRPGSLLWWYIWAVVASAAAVATVAAAGLHGRDVVALASHPALWLVAGPVAVTALRPVVPTGRGGDGTFALVVFLFALLLNVGLGAVVVLCAVTMAFRGALYRQALHRNLFNVGQHVLTLFASWLVLRAFAIDPTPLHRWTFSERHVDIVQLVAVALAGLAYLVVNNGSVMFAVKLVENRPLRTVLREELRHIVRVGLAMVSLSPLVLVVMAHMWVLVPLFYPALAALYHNATLSVEHEHDALHDSLTGLGNRQLLYREATKALDELPRRGGGVALLVIDLDKFKDVNDSLGHVAGDLLLQAVAQRMSAGVRAGDVIARLGGDEFVVLVAEVADVAAARMAAVRLLERVNGPCRLGPADATVPVRASLGLAVAPQHGADFDALLRRADRAMYAAKASGCGVAVYDPRRDERTPVRHDVVLDVAAAAATD